MRFFLLLAVILLMNARVWWKVRCAFFNGGASIAVGIFMLLLPFLPIILWGLCGPGIYPRALEQLSWIWLAWSFWAFIVFLLVDVWNVTLWLITFCPKCSGALRWFASDRTACWIALGWVIVASIWGSMEVEAIRVHRIEIATPYLPEELQEYRIVQISDVHIGPAASWRRLRKMVCLIEECRPDMLVSTGDLIDGATEREKKMVDDLAKMAVARGKWYAVTGNHDVHSGLELSRQEHRRAGFQLLENQETQVEPWLWLYGESDPSARRITQASNHGHSAVGKGMSRNAHIPDIPQGCFSLYLYHRPVYRGAHLQLSGHSHGGQIVPFNFFIRFQHPFKEGVLHPFSSGFLYVSPGTGVWGPPYRVMSPPEVTLFVLKRAEQAK